MQINSIKDRILESVNKVINCDDYDLNDIIFCQRYGFAAVVMVYILMELSVEFGFIINDELVDELEMCTFSILETLMEKYGSVT